MELMHTMSRKGYARLGADMVIPSTLFVHSQSSYMALHIIASIAF